jgi:hypothetical protein
MQQFTLSEPTQEEIDTFKTDFEKFLDERSMQFTPYPIFKPSEEQGKWHIECGISLSKKTPVEEVKEPEVISAPEELATVPSPQDETVNTNA